MVIYFPLTIVWLGWVIELEIGKLLIIFLVRSKVQLICCYIIVVELF